MTDYIGPITDGFINKCIQEVKKKKVKEKIMGEIIDPLLKDLSIRYYPYFVTVISILITMTLLLIAIIILLVCYKYSTKIKTE